MGSDAGESGDLIARAENLFEDGLNHYELDRFVEALAEVWREAHMLLSTPDLIDRADLDPLRAALAVHNGNALDALDYLEGALAAYGRAGDLHALPHLATKPEPDCVRADLAINEGDTLESCGHKEEALVAYYRARDLLALPHLARDAELDDDRAILAMNEGISLDSLGRFEEALSAYRAASRLWSSQRDLPLPEQEGFALCLAFMCTLLDEMAVEDPAAARAWALGSSDRLVEMLDLALPERKVWDDLRYDFAMFHARWLEWCLRSGDPADRSLVPRVLAAVQGRRLVAETLEQAMALHPRSAMCSRSRPRCGRSWKHWQAVAVMGPIEGANVFVSREGKWRASFVPALLRVYPFKLTGAGELALWEDYPPEPLAAEGVQPFYKSCALAPWLQQTLNFLPTVQSGIGETHRVLESVNGRVKVSQRAA